MFSGGIRQSLHAVPIEMFLVEWEVKTNSENYLFSFLDPCLDDCESPIAYTRLEAAQSENNSDNCHSEKKMSYTSITGAVEQRVEALVSTLSH